MKVILLRDVARIGKRFEIVNVPDGYALNKLIPQKDAEAATPVNVKRVQEKAKLSTKNKEDEVSAIKLIVSACVEKPLQIKMEANEQGHLFQAVHVSDIVAAAKALGLDIPAQFIKIEETIKEVGNAKVTLATADFQSFLPVEVIAK